MIRIYGTDIFYNNETGDILEITQEIKGTICEQIRPNTLSISEKFNLAPGQVSVIEVPNGGLNNMIASDRNIIKVNPNLNKLILTEPGGYFNINYNEIEDDQQHEYTQEQILSFYNDHYIYNLKNLLNVEDISFDFLSLDQLKISEEKLSSAWMTYDDDDYIMDAFDDRSLIGKDIVENGMFWPLVAVLDEEDGLYEVNEGMHRVISAKICQSEGTWDNRSLLTIIIPDSVNELGFGNKSMKRLPIPMRARAPFISKFYDLGYINPDNEDIINEEMELRNMVFIDDAHEIVEYDIFTYRELLTSSQIFVRWLRDLFYNLKEDNIIVKGNEIINSRDAFGLWRSDV